VNEIGRNSATKGYGYKKQRSITIVNPIHKENLEKLKFCLHDTAAKKIF
jgi:hypothetical protein